MQSGMILLIVAFSSVATYAVSRRTTEVGRPSLRRAVLSMLEFVGLSVGFFVANVVIGMVAILVIRTVTPVFISIYLIGDISLLALSILQGFLLGSLRRLG